MSITVEDMSQIPRFAGIHGAGVMPVFGVEKESLRANGVELIGDDGKPLYRNVEVVEIRIPGDPTLKTRKRVTDVERKRFAEAYKLWKDGGDMSVIAGTPLSELPGVTKSFVDLLKVWEVSSIEQLASLTDSRAQAIGAGVMQRVVQARDWVTRAKDGAGDIQSARDLAEMKKLLDKLTARTEAAEREAEGLKLAMKAMRRNDDDDAEEEAPKLKRRRGRPPKSKSSNKGAGSVEAANPNAMRPEDIGSLVDREIVGDDPLSDGDGDYDPAEELLASAAE